jgi:tetratricopeptide (TPR) repeat protein
MKSLLSSGFLTKMKEPRFFLGLLFVISLLLFKGCKQAENKVVVCSFDENFFMGKQLGAEGKSDSAIYFLQEALRCEGPVDSVLRVLLELGDQYRLQSDFIAAERMIQRFDSVFHADKIKDSSLVAEKYHLKGKILTSRGAYEEALGHFNNSITIKNRLYGAHQPVHAKTYNYMGIVYLYQNLYRSALDYFDSSLMICTVHHVVGKDASDSHMNKGIVYSILGHYEEAIRSFNQSRAIQELNPSVYKDLGEFYINYGNFLRSVGESSESIRMYERADSILKKYQNVKNLSISQLYNNIANAYYQRGDYEKARVYYSNVINSMKERIDDRHPNLLIVRKTIWPLSITF